MDAYELVIRQGTGSFAVVWKARRRGDGAIVAIKELKERAGSWESLLEQPEIAVMRALGAHANVLRLHSVVLLAGRAYMVLDQCDCSVYQAMSSARSLASGRSSFAEGEVRWLMRAVLSGLAHVHARGIMHRDVKPENILLCSADGTAKLCDFGQSRATALSPARPRTEYVSTRWYRAPELLLHSPTYGAPIDVWAAGCLMAECYTFRPVFPGSSEPDTLMRIVSALGPPRPGDGPGSWREGDELAHRAGLRWPDVRHASLASLIPKASAAAISVIAAALQWDPAKRPTAAALLGHAFFADATGGVRDMPVPPTGATAMRPGEEAAAKSDAAAAQVAIDAALVAKLAGRNAGEEEGKDSESKDGEEEGKHEERRGDGKAGSSDEDRISRVTSAPLSRGTGGFLPGRAAPALAVHPGGGAASTRSAVALNPFARAIGERASAPDTSAAVPTEDASSGDEDARPVFVPSVVGSGGRAAWVHGAVTGVRPRPDAFGDADGGGGQQDEYIPSALDEK
jgi:protein kinase